MAKTYYDLVTAIKDHLEAEQFVGTVSTGDIFDLDLNKRQIYSLAHFNVNNLTMNGNVWVFNLDLIVMDLVDENTNPKTDLVINNDNLNDVFNTQLFVLGNLIESLRRGALFDNQFQLSGTPSVESFKDRFDSAVAGWTMTFDVEVRSDAFIC